MTQILVELPFPGPVATGEHTDLSWPALESRAELRVDLERYWAGLWRPSEVNGTAQCL